jgi:hypothetical protein
MPTIPAIAPVTPSTGAESQSEASPASRATALEVAYTQLLAPLVIRRIFIFVISVVFRGYFGEHIYIFESGLD